MQSALVSHRRTIPVVRATGLAIHFLARHPSTFAQHITVLSLQYAWYLRVFWLRSGVLETVVAFTEVL